MAVRTDRVSPNQASQGVIYAEKSGLYQESSTALHEVGTRMKLQDGRTFYYAKCRAAIPEAGRAVGAIQLVQGEEDTSVTEAIGSKELSVTAVAQTGVSYVNGYALVISGTGAGQTHKIRDCTTTAAAGTATVYLYDELVTATSTANVILYTNPFWNVGESLTNGQECLYLGVNPIAVTANYYFWLQTWGWASTMAGDSLGNAVAERECFASATGSSTLSTSVGAVGRQVIGYRTYDSVDAVAGEWELTYLTCVP